MYIVAYVGEIYMRTRHAYVLGILGSCGRSPKYSLLAARVWSNEKPAHGVAAKRA